MYFTDRGIEELVERRGEESVTLEWVGEQLRNFVDAHPEFETPIERFATLASALSSMGYAPVVIGGEQERDLAAAITAAATDAKSLVGQTTFSDLLALGRDAALAVGNDTGPMHLFAAAGCPLLVLFGADSSPALNAPQGDHVKALQAKPIADLTVEQVLNALPKARALP